MELPRENFKEIWMRKGTSTRDTFHPSEMRYSLNFNIENVMHADFSRKSLEFAMTDKGLFENL